MIEIKTDLALEAHELAAKNKKHKLDGVIFRETQENGIKLTRVEILDSQGEEATGKPCGIYLTLDTGRLWEYGSSELSVAVDMIANKIKELSGDCQSVLVVGLGNATITADALGPCVISHLIVTRHLKDEEPAVFNDLGFSDICAIAPGVLSQTGIETFEIVKSLVDKLSPSLVIAIDSLASRDISRLGSTVQISNTGIAPGSGIANRRVALNQESLGVPVIAIGIPTVVDALTLTANVMEMCGLNVDDIDGNSINQCKNMFVTPKDSDRIISFMSKVIGHSINLAFHTKLSYEEMVSISS